MKRITFPGFLYTLTASMVLAQIPPAPTAKRADTGSAPKLFVAARMKDLGTVIDGDKVNISWTIENQGDAPLVIDRTVSTCGCTIVQLGEADKVIPPKGSLELKAVFDSTGRRDAQNKTITVVSNDPIEPDLKLEFKVMIEQLFQMEPAGLVNLRQVRRGDKVAKGVDFLPSGTRKSVMIKNVDPAPDAQIEWSIELLPSPQGEGQRLLFKIPDTVALGTINTSVNVKLSVDGIERERLVPLRGEVVGELVWTPKLIDATRQPSLPGKKLVPVTLSSTRTAPFKVSRVESGVLLDPTIEERKKGDSGTEYLVSVAVRPDAPPGPFAATLRLYTNVLDQPVVEIPVFGIVAPLIEVDPPVILLRDDGTSAGKRRHVKVQAQPSAELNIGKITCDDPRVKTSLDEVALASYRHLRYIDVEFIGTMPEGRRETKLVVSTNLPGTEKLEIPLIIESGKR